ncbi:MAG TPA: hypothetical protein VE377_23400 [Candidatus Dormibacteraeota bacterium]|nr:hypothetical protein [Candidatus Dormibacteraeota bacterium]
MYRYRSALCGLAGVLFLTHFSVGQATVNESLETAYIYVDALKGSDSNSGSSSKPLKTIGAAASMAETNNQSGIGSRVTINPGTYRESVSLQYNKKDTSLPITFEAATNGTVIVSGGTVYTGWATYSQNSKIYTTGWTHQWGTCPQQTSCPYQQDIVMRQELVAVNGTVLTQVMSINAMTQGTFYVDEQGAQLYVWPASGINLNAATVEVAETPTLFTIQHKNNIVVRGLTFQYANTCHASAAVVVQGSSSNILLDSDTFQWNNGQGLSVSNPTTYFTVENSTAQHNGDSGFQESQTKYGLWQSDTTSYNNWRGAQGAFYACNTSGLHVWGAHNDTINSLTTSFNETYGIHWDTDNASISNTGLNATSNLLTGVFMEKDEGPITFSNSYFCHQNATPAVAGFVLRNSEGVSVTNSVLLDNNNAQIAMIGIKGGIQVTNWETGVTTNLITQNFTNKSNTIQGTTSSQLVFKDSYLDGTDWSTFQSTLTSSNNTWWNAYNSSTPYLLPTPKAGTKDDFSGWKSATSKDSNSSFAAPSGSPGSACSLTPVGTDFWITIDNALLTVQQGKSATYNLTLTPLNFTKTATLTLDGVTGIKGLSATVSPSSITKSGTATLTVTTTSSTPKGTYSITAIANQGSTTRTVTTQLTVN